MADSMRIFVSLLALLLFFGALGFAIVAGLYAYYAKDLPDPSLLAQRSLFQTARILDRNGELIQEINDPSGGRRTLVRIADISPLVLNATIAAEDASFYQNPGFDPRAIVRALYQWARYGSPQSGGSTITQQLVKNTLLGPEQTGARKIKEVFLAIELGRRYTKPQILEMYLNEISYGNGAYGIEAASQTYFGKSARALALTEASLVVGLPQAPTYYDPYTNLAAAKERQRYVLEQMVRTGTISPAQAAEADQAHLELRPLAAESAPSPAPHFAAYVRQLLEEQFGTNALYRGGLQVTTTLDLRAERIAEQVAREHIGALLNRNAHNAALVCIQPGTGEILAMLGSVDFTDAAISGQVNVALALRQPGSTLKPFTYLTALGKGWSPATVLMDVPTTFGGDYAPRDFDNQFRGPVSIREALAQSLNVPAVETLQFVGVPEMLATAHRMGIQDLRDPRRYGLSVTLGGGEVKLLDLTFAYGVLANGGRQVGLPVGADRLVPEFRQFNPVAILKVVDSTGKTLSSYAPPSGTQVVDARLVYQVQSILSDNDARAPTYGPNSPLVLPGHTAAVKSGTTDNFRDSWVVGFTPDLVTGVWVGNSDNSPMTDVLGVAGAGEIWHAFMAQMLAGTADRQFRPPDGVVQAEVCRLSGLLPTPDCIQNDLPIHGVVRDVFAANLNLPITRDAQSRRVEVCKLTGELATPLVPKNAREFQIFAQFPPEYQEWAQANGYPAPPTLPCDDVYKGERIATFTAPQANEFIQAGTRLEITGSASIDDFHHYTLEVGPGATPSTWFTLTDQRTEAVDNGLLGVWTTAGAQPGLHTLRLRVFDSFGNGQEALLRMSVSPAPTPTPTPLPTPTPRPTLAATIVPTRAPTVPSRLPPLPTPGPSRPLARR